MRNFIKLIFVFCLSYSYAQNDAKCQVVNKELTGVYIGDCKDGLASGKGSFKFSNGGFLYVGEFENGKMHGKGEMYSITKGEKKLISKGTWKDNVYVQVKSKSSYDVLFKVNLDRYTLRRVGDGNKISINFYRNGARNGVSGLTIFNNNGIEVNGGQIRRYEDLIFPFKSRIEYTSRSKLETGRVKVVFDFIINEPGEWELSLYN